MCYGSGYFATWRKLDTASIRAIGSTKNQIKERFQKFANTTLSDSEAYSKIGATVSVGYESFQILYLSPAWF
jgi:chitinase